MTTNQVRQRIREMETVDLQRIRIATLKAKLRPLLEIYLSRVIDVNPAKAIYRARKNKGSTLFTRVRKLWYPPIGRARINRANRNRCPVFYAADSENTAILELRPRRGDVITVIECRLKTDASPLLIPLGIHELARRHNVQIGGREVPTEGLLREDEALSKNKLIGAFLRRAFRQPVSETDGYKYKATIAVAELLSEFEFWGMPGRPDGIAYPSVASGLRAANIALSCEAVDRLYEPVSCTVIRINRALGPSRYSGSACSAVGIEAGGRIKWTL